MDENQIGPNMVRPGGFTSPHHTKAQGAECNGMGGPV